MLFPYVLFFNIEHETRAILCCWFWVCIYLLEKYVKTEKIWKLTSWQKTVIEGIHKVRLFHEPLVWLEIGQKVGHSGRARVKSVFLLYEFTCWQNDIKTTKIKKLYFWKSKFNEGSYVMRLHPELLVCESLHFLASLFSSISSKMHWFIY